MSGKVAVTVHQGCTVYDQCRQCGAEVTFKRERPVLYSMQADGPVPVCPTCAERDDPATVALWKLLDGERAHELPPAAAAPDRQGFDPFADLDNPANPHGWLQAPAPAALVVVVSEGCAVSLFSTGSREELADVAAEALAAGKPAGRILAAAAEAVGFPSVSGRLIATAQALAARSAYQGCVTAAGGAITCEGACADCLTLGNLVELSEIQYGSASPFQLKETRTPAPSGGRWHDPLSEGLRF